METEDLEDLIRPYLVSHATVLPVPRDAASPVAVTWVLPSSTRVRLNSPVTPEPLSVWIRILIGLNGNPVRSRSDTEGRSEADHELRRRSGVRQIHELSKLHAGNIPGRILIEINIE